MTIVEQIFASLYNHQFFNPQSNLYLGNLVPVPVKPPDQKQVDLKRPLAGGCQCGNTEGNGLLDLTGMEISGFTSIQGQSYTSTATDDYTEFTMPLLLSSSVVPASEGDLIELNKQANSCPNVGVRGKTCEDCFLCTSGSPIGGPVTPEQAGLTGYTGVRGTGAFLCRQACSDGTTVTPTGRFLFAMNHVRLTLTIQLYIPADVNQPIYVKVPQLTLAAPQTEDLTLTLLHDDGSLPEYDSRKIGTDEAANNFYFAQQTISFPAVGVTSVTQTIADALQSHFTEINNSAEIRQDVEQKVNDYLKTLPF